MKIIVERKELSEAVGKLSRAVSNKSAVPVLEGILFSAEEDKLTMAAYNYEIGMKKELPIRCIEAGDIVIGAKLLGDILRKLPENEVEIYSDEKNVCHISCGSSNFDIVGIEAVEFPEIPTAAGGKELKMPGNMLKSMVRQTIFACEEINSMPMYTGIYFEVEPDYIKLVALDGLRIAIRKETAKNENPMRFVITGKSISEVFRMIESEEESVEMTIGKNHISFNINGYYLVSRLIEGNYLDYNSVIKKEYKTKLRVNTNEFIESLERISLIINNPSNTPVRCNIKEDEMALTCATTMGRAKDSCPTEIEGEPIELGFNARFMTEAMKATECDEVEITMCGDISPITIKPIEGEEFLYIVMPMRIRNA